MIKIPFIRNVVFGCAAIVFLSIFSTGVFAQRDPNLITSRHYIGVEAGVNEGWFSGQSSDFYFTYSYPYSDDPANPVSQKIGFSNLGNGIGFHIAVTLDYALSDLISIQGKAFYRSNSSSHTENQNFICKGLVDTSGVKAPDDSSATIENYYKLKLGYVGLSAAARIQIIPGSWYGLVGIEYSGLVSNEFSGHQKIVSSNRGCQFLNLPSGTPTSPAVTEADFDQTSGNHFNSSALALKVGTGTFIELGTSHWVLAPEINVGIPLAVFFDKTTGDNYSSASVTAPKFWYASFSIALKFPFGAMTKEDMQ